MAVNTSHFSNRFDREKWLSLGTRSSGVARLIEKERPPFLNYYFHYFRCREISSCSILASLLCRTHHSCAIDLSSFLSLVSSFVPFPPPTPPASTSMCLIKALWRVRVRVERAVPFCVLCVWCWVMGRALFLFFTQHSMFRATWLYSCALLFAIKHVQVCGHTTLSILPRMGP